MDPAQLLAVTRRHWILLSFLMLVGLAGGLTVQALTTPTYRSTTTVLFALNRAGSIGEAADGNNYVQDLVPSFTKVVTMPIVMNPVVERLGLRMSSRELAQQVEVTTTPAGTVAQISVVDSDAAQAAAIANAVASQFSNTLTQLSPRNNANAASVTVTTVTPATAGTVPISPSRNRNALGGLAAGIVAGIVAVSIRSSIVTRPLTTRNEVERVTEVPVLATIVADPRSAERPLPTWTHPATARSEGFRALETTLLNRGDATGSSLAVVSPLRGEGRSSVAVNLAVSLYRASQRVLLIDADLRGAAVAAALDLDGSRGLTDLLGGRATFQDVVQAWPGQANGDHTLDVIATGSAGPNPSELLASYAMVELLKGAKERYDVVIIDTPALGDSTDSALIASRVDGTLLLVDAPHTKERHLVDALSRLELAGARVLGIVLNRSASVTASGYAPV